MLELGITARAMLRVRRIPGYIRWETFAKRVYLRVALRVFGAAFRAVTAHAWECRRELADWEEGRRIALGTLPQGPCITLEKQGHVIRMIGTGLREPHVSLLFKNLDSAVMVFTTIMGVSQAACENRVLIKGDNAMAMECLRILDIIMIYLLPRFILNRNFRTRPQFRPRQYLTMVWIYAALLPALAGTFLTDGRNRSGEGQS